MPRSLGQNLPRAKQINRSLVLEQVLYQGPMTRQQIAKNLGLTSATITNFAAKLIREGLLQEVGFVDEGRLGRKSVSLALRGDRYAVMAIHLRASDMEIGFVGASGAVTKRRSAAYPPQMSKSSFLQFIRDQVNLQFELRGDLQVVAIGIGSRGSLVPGREVLVVSPDPRFDTVGLQREISSYIHLPVLLRSNTMGMALAEKMFGGCRQTDDFLLIYMGPSGIGSGLVFQGQAHQGSGLSLTGLGHMRYADDGPACECGRNGCLELYASETAILQSCGLASTVELADRIEAGDKRAAEAVEEAARHLARVLVSFLSMVDLQRVVLGGTLSGSQFPLVAKLRDGLSLYAGIHRDARIEVTASELGTDLGIIGAAAPAIYDYIIRGDEFPEVEG